MTDQSDPNPPVWWSGPKGPGAEAYYLEHYAEIEEKYQRWCAINIRDPEDVGSMTDYEDTFR